MKRSLKLLSLLVLLVFFGCGDGKKEKAKDGFQLERKKESQEVVADVNTIALSSNDLMQFDKAELKVKAGAEVTLTLRHTGKMDKNVMGHNFVLLKNGTDIVAFAAKAAVARATDYIPEGDEVIAHTGLIGGGERTSITFDAPAPGTYTYICSFPGHYGVMQGKLIVE